MLHLHRLPNLFGRFSLLLLAVILCGCQSLPPFNLLPSVRNRNQQQVLSTNIQMQAEVMRFADVYSVVMAQGLDDFAAAVNTPRARTQALERKVNQVNAAFTIATGASPIVNLMDMVVLVTLTRAVQEDYYVGQVYGDKARPLLEILKIQEDDIWKIAAYHLTQEELRQMHQLIADWRKKFPDQRYTGFLRFSEFATLLGTNVEAEERRKGSIFNLLLIDPLSNLEPATRQIAQTRYLAERAMYYGQRLPMILQWRGELLFLKMSGSPDVQHVLSMSESWTKVIEQFPGLIPREREAAINQFLAGLANESTNLINNMAAHGTNATALLTNLQSTLATGREMAQAGTELVKSSDGLFQRYQKFQERPTPTNSRPFDIREYTKFMSATSNAATQMDAMFTSGGQNLPKVQETGQALSDHIFRLALLLILAIAVVAFLYRWVVWALFRPRQRT